MSVEMSTSVAAFASEGIVPPVLMSSHALKDVESHTVGTRRSGEVPGLRDRSSNGRVPASASACPVAPSRVLPSSGMSSSVVFNDRLSLRASSGGEPDEYGSAKPYRPIRAQPVSPETRGLSVLTLGFRGGYEVIENGCGRLRAPPRRGRRGIRAWRQNL